MTGRFVLFAALLLALPAHPLAAYAAPAGDPAAGSPSGAVYELPFEKGRADAAPKGKAGGGSDGTGRTGGGDAGGGSNGSETSYYRSENNFGSSSQVPGAPSFAGSGTGGSGSGDGNGAAAAGSGGGSGSDPIGAVTGGATTEQLVDTGNTSTAGSVALLAGIALLAAALAAAALRARRGPQAGSP